MKTSTLTIRLDENLDDLLTMANRRSGRNRSQIAREGVRAMIEGRGRTFLGWLLVLLFAGGAAAGADAGGAG